jgi:hypothetical protein
MRAMSKLYFLPLRPAFDSAGITVPGSQHWFTLAGTNTPSAPYTDSTLTTRLENPVIANGIGYLPPIYLNETPAFYRVRVYLPDAEVGVDTPIEEYDPYEPANAILTYLGDSGFDGLLVDAPSLIVPTGIDAISTTGADVLDHGGANYVAGTKPTTRSGFASANTRNFVLSKEQVITPQPFYQATDPDMQNATQGAVDYLAAIAGNGNGVDAFKSSPKLLCPADAGGGQRKYVMHGPVEFRHTLIFEGEGGQNGPGSFGTTCFQFPDDVNSFITHFPGTVGTEDLGGTGGGGHNVTLRNFMIAGPATGTVGNKDAIVCRTPTIIEDVYGRGLKGVLVRMWTGTVDGHNYGGDCSTSRLVRVKGEACKGTLSIRGTDSNIIRTEQCHGYQNMQFALFDQNAAGSNNHTNWHSTYNGIPAPSAGPFTQCSYSGNLYTPNLGCVNFASDAATSTLLAANPPSGTTAHNAYWVYVRAGGATATTPLYSSGGPWIWGGGYMIATPYATVLDSCYIEGGGDMSQALNNQTEWRGGTIDRTQVYGGTIHGITDDGVTIERQGTSALRMVSAAGNSLWVACDFADVVFAYLNAIQGGALEYWTPSEHHFYTQSGGSRLDILALAYYGIALAGSGKALYNNGNKVVGERGAAVADAAALTSVNATNVAAAPTQAEFNAFVAEFNKLRTDLGATRTTLNTGLARLRATGGHGLVAD